MYVQRRIQCQGVGFGTVIVFGRDDFDIGNVFQRLVQGDDAGGLVAVVVRNQNFFHGLSVGMVIATNTSP